MIIRSLNLSEKTLYNHVVKHPLQTWEWGDFRKETGVSIERLGFFQDSTLSTGLQVSFHPIPHLPFTVGYCPRGPMPDEEQLQALMDIGKQHKALFIKLEPQVASPVGSPSAHDAVKKFLLDRGAVAGRPLFSRYTFVLDIRPSEEELLEHMKPKTRYNIHLAEKKGVEIFEDSTEQGLEDYLTVLKETTSRQGFYAHSEKYFRNMWAALKDSGMVHIFKAMFEGRALVVWMMFVHNGVLYYPYGASSSQHRELMASNLMMWRMIQYGKFQKCTKFDMWGALGPDADPKDPWYGFHKFKEGYGGVLTEFLGSYDFVLQPQLYSLFRKVEDIRWKLLRLKAKFLRH